MVLIAAVIVGFVTEVARGQDGAPYSMLGAIGGVAYMLRSAARIAVPWELAHIGVWNSLWLGPEGPVSVALFAVANGLLVLNLVLLFVGARRPLYDRLAGTVVQARRSNSMAVQRPRRKTVEARADT